MSSTENEGVENDNDIPGTEKLNAKIGGDQDDTTEEVQGAESGATTAESPGNKVELPDANSQRSSLSTNQTNSIGENDN